MSRRSGSGPISDPRLDQRLKIGAIAPEPSPAQEIALLRQVVANLIQDNAAALHYVKVIHRVLWWLGLGTDEWNRAEADIAAIDRDGEAAQVTPPNADFRAVRYRDLMLVTLGASTAIEAMADLLIEKGILTADELRRSTEEHTAKAVAAINAAQAKDNVVPLHQAEEQ